MWTGYPGKRAASSPFMAAIAHGDARVRSADRDDLRLKRARLLEREAPGQFQQQRWFDVRDCAHSSSSANKEKGLENEGIAAHQHIDADAERTLDARRERSARDPRRPRPAAASSRTTLQARVFPVRSGMVPAYTGAGTEPSNAR